MGENVMELLRVATLVAATLATGLVAGLLFAWVTSVMPGLARADDRTFVGAFQGMDRAIVNPLFVTVFVAALILPGLVVLLHLGAEQRPALPWAVAGLVLASATVAITRAVHLPLNAAIQAAGPADRIADLAAVRAALAARWVRWNVVRTVTATAAFACLIVAGLR